MDPNAKFEPEAIRQLKFSDITPNLSPDVMVFIAPDWSKMRIEGTFSTEDVKDDGTWKSLSKDPNVWINSKHKSFPIPKLAYGHLDNIVAMLRRWAVDELEDIGILSPNENQVDEMCAKKCLQWSALIQEQQIRKKKNERRQSRRSDKPQEVKEPKMADADKLDLKNGWYWLGATGYSHIIALVIDGKVAGFGNFAEPLTTDLHAGVKLLESNPAKQNWSEGGFTLHTRFIAGQNEIVLDQMQHRPDQLQFVKSITHNMEGKPLSSEGPSLAFLAGCLGLVGLVAAGSHTMAKTRVRQQQQEASHVRNR